MKKADRILIEAVVSTLRGVTFALINRGVALIKRCGLRLHMGGQQGLKAGFDRRNKRGMFRVGWQVEKALERAFGITQLRAESACLLLPVRLC